jgi:hypothetical protein
MSLSPQVGNIRSRIDVEHHLAALIGPHPGRGQRQTVSARRQITKNVAAIAPGGCFESEALVFILLIC